MSAYFAFILFFFSLSFVMTIVVAVFGLRYDNGISSRIDLGIFNSLSYVEKCLMGWFGLMEICWILILIQGISALIKLF